MEKVDRERVQEYVKRLESLRSLLINCESEAEQCLSYAPMEACESLLKDLLGTLKEKGQSLQEAMEYWQYQLEEG